mmetsp:Transcript_36369/g.103944  ORF Transcript_36369/g.103944 Transcript_36369/m.103944 type:complete len:244 (+) Transcript_36369:497-1228(+)
MSVVHRFTVFDPYAGAPACWSAVMAACALLGGSASISPAKLPKGTSVTFKVGSLRAFTTARRASCAIDWALWFPVLQKGTSGRSEKRGYSGARGASKFCMSYSTFSCRLMSLSRVAVKGSPTGRRNSNSAASFWALPTAEVWLKSPSSPRLRISSAWHLVASLRASSSSPRVAKSGRSTRPSPSSLSSRSGFAGAATASRPPATRAASWSPSTRSRMLEMGQDRGAVRASGGLGSGTGAFSAM